MAAKFIFEPTHFVGAERLGEGGGIALVGVLFKRSSLGEDFAEEPRAPANPGLAGGVLDGRVRLVGCAQSQKRTEFELGRNGLTIEASFA